MKCTSNWKKTSEKGFVALIPCGKCLACSITRQQEWILRLGLEQKAFGSSSFATFTYADDTLGLAPLEYSHFNSFMKRLRVNTGQKIRFFCVGERGPNTNRAHWHAILLGYDFQNLTAQSLTPSLRLYDVPEWPYGAVTVGTVTPKSLGYTTRYSLKTDQESKRIVRMSQGLGKTYAEDLSSYLWKNKPANYCTPKGSRLLISLPWHLKWQGKSYPLSRSMRSWMKSKTEELASKEDTPIDFWSPSDWVSYDQAERLSRVRDISLTEAKAHLRWCGDPTYELTSYIDYAQSEALRLHKSATQKATL